MTFDGAFLATTLLETPREPIYLVLVDLGAKKVPPAKTDVCLSEPRACDGGVHVRVGTSLHMLWREFIHALAGIYICVGGSLYGSSAKCALGCEGMRCEA